MCCENKPRRLGAWVWPLALAASGAVCAAAMADAASETAAGETTDFGRFGAITLYRGAAEPREVVLFLSGDGGWNLGVIAMAQRLADKGALVAGIDTRHYLGELEKAAEACVSPAQDLDMLSHDLQSKLSINPYRQPTLVGYSSGATLVYAALGEAPEGLFKGALSLGFCPDLDLKKPVCKGAGIAATPRIDAKGQLTGVDFLPARVPPGKWVVLQGQTDQVCPAPPTQKFVATVPGAEIVLLPKVGHGYSVARNWVPQFEAAFERITAESPKTTAKPAATP
jgi:type IV secretory pathway VirJ component